MSVREALRLLLFPLLILSLGTVQSAPADPEGAANRQPERLREDAGLTLHGVVQQALAYHPRRQVIEARNAEAKALRQQAESPLTGAPALALRYQTDQVGSQEGLREWETGIALPLWWPGQRRARQAVAGEVARVAESEGGALRLEIAGAVRESLGELALLKNRLQLAEHEWRTAQALERDVAQRVEAGELAHTDLLLARDETLSRQALYLGALAELENGEQRYRALTGMDRVPPTPKEPLSAARAIAQEHPRLAEVQAAVDRARAEVESVRQDRLGNPELTLGTRHEKEQDGEPYSNTLGVSVRVPLGSRAHAAPRVAQAELALAEAQAARDAVRRELETGLQQAQNTLRTTRAALALAQRQHELAQENLRLARKAFTLGEIDLVGLLRVQSLAFAAERNLQQRGLQLDLDIARYNQAIGVVP